MEWETPREAMLRAENNRLRAENEYLRRAVGVGDMTVTPMAVIENIRLSSLPDELRLPAVGSIRGSLSRYGNYHVLARIRLERAEDLAVQYYAPADIVKAKATYAINELLPYMHKQFIQALGHSVAKRDAA